MPKDFSSNQGRVAPTTGRTPRESGTPKTGFTESPKGECTPKGPGPGVGKNPRGIR